MSQSASLFEIRHSASHVLAQAVLNVFPDAKLAIGPAIDDGFYYDFDLPRSLTPEDLTVLEDKMKQIIAEHQTFKQYDLPADQAKELMESRHQSYKLELINDLQLPSYSFYENGPFLDLCKGPHVNNTESIGAVKLLKVAGAYWKGSEKNKMLQRIYGTAFHTQAELDTYLHRMAEAQKRDHRLLGKELDLFSVSDEIGGGLILWHPKGAKVRYLIEEFWRQQHFKAGYDLLSTPHVGKAELWKTSGHLDFYKENMYAAMDVEDHDYFLKPMNCPFHCLIYKTQSRSYRQLPLRFAELGTVYRYERSGVLHGLMRVRGFTQDDAHIICTEEQMEGEIMRVLTFCTDMLKAFGFDRFKVFLSTRPKEKYVGDLTLWAAAEAALARAIEQLGIPYEVDDGGGAFYGPKIDIKIEDAIGREWQCSTVQFDFNLPERFDMTYIGSDGAKKRPYMVHRALLGSIERFFGVLIEHYEGRFPLWLAPVQVKLITVNDSVAAYAQTVQDALEAHGFRVEPDLSSDRLGQKIRQATLEKVPYSLVIGGKEAEQGTISVRKHNDDLGSMTVADLVQHLQAQLAGTQ
ncbi:MAG: threonine--tRNA ligase [Candidatus Margulisiibacteriota bacterium]